MTKSTFDKFKKIVFQEDLIGYCDKCGEYVGTDSNDQYGHTFTCIGTPEGLKRLKINEENRNKTINRFDHILEYQSSKVCELIKQLSDDIK
jgi:hypothetical protein